MKSTTLLNTTQSRAMGWRLYATNAPESKLPLDKAVLVYRGSPNLEHNHLRLKGQPLGLRPLYVQCQDHATGKIALLSVVPTHFSEACGA